MTHTTNTISNYDNSYSNSTNITPINSTETSHSRNDIINNKRKRPSDVQLTLHSHCPPSTKLPRPSTTAASTLITEDANIPHNTLNSYEDMDIATNGGNETHDQLANNRNLDGNLNIPVNTLSIMPYTCNINTTQLSNNNVYKTIVYNITDVSDTTASYVSCNCIEPQSHAPECTVSPFVNTSSENNVIKPPLSRYQALRYPRTHKGTQTVKKPTSAKHEPASKTKRSGIG